MSSFWGFCDIYASMYVWYTYYITYTYKIQNLISSADGAGII